MQDVGEAAVQARSPEDLQTHLRRGGRDARAVRQGPGEEQVVHKVPSAEGVHGAFRTEGGAAENIEREWVGGI